jgi:glyoxylase-like metal-dependent hydrolase (beta-lactamase superfamily II)
MIIIRYHGTNAYFLPVIGGLLAVDCGWPCSLPEYRRLMKEQGLRFQDLRHVIVTHLHMDHAGLLGEFQRAGIDCVLIGEQNPAAVDEMERVIRKNRDYADYAPVDLGAMRRVSVAEFNASPPGQASIEAIATPSHSCDSLSFLLGKDAIVGDLTPRAQLMDGDAAHTDWKLLVSRGVELVYPSHAPMFRL